MSINCGTQSNIRVKSYCHLNLLRASVFNFERLDIIWDSIIHPVKSNHRLIFLIASVLNFERLDILRDTIGHPSKRLLSFEFAESYCFDFRESRYITGLNQTSE